MSRGGLLLDEPDRSRPVVSHGKGVHLWDVTGRRYLDAVGGVHAVTIGHGVDEIAQAAARQSAAVAFTSTRQFVSEAAVRLADHVTALLPEGLDWVYFVSSGSEAAEMALQLCHLYWTSRGEPKRRLVVGRWNSYHGGTVAAASMGGHRPQRSRIEPLLLPFPHIETPHCARCPFGLRYPECELRCANELADVVEAAGRDTVAAFIAEPIVGTTGGAIVPPPGYYERIREICDEYGLLFIADEVVTGFGRTGLDFGLARWSVTPDLVLCSKGMSSGYVPLGAVVVHAEVITTIRAAGLHPNLRSTYSAHPVSCAVGLAVQEYIRTHNLVERCARLGTYLKSLLETMATDCPTVYEVRGTGLLLGVELAAPDGTPLPRNGRLAERVVTHAQTAGLIILGGSGTPRSPDGDHVLVSPPFVVTEEDCQELVALLHRAIDAAVGE